MATVSMTRRTRWWRAFAAGALVLTVPALAAGPAVGSPAAERAPDPAARAGEPTTAGMIAYVIGVGTQGETRIATAWTDGSHRRLLTKRGNSYAPAWSPDGTQLAYTTYRGIGLMSATGAGQHLILTDGQYPAWAPDGRRLSYACDAGLCVRDLVTGVSSVVVPNTDDWPGVESSSWSPDGSSIAFTRISAEGDDYSSDIQIFTVHADGTGLLAVPGTAPDGDYPLWSPDGMNLMYTQHYSGRGGETSGDVWLVHPDGTARSSVLALPGPDFASSWSPDGSRVVVSSAAAYYPGMDGIWVLRPDGTDRQLVVREGWAAVWRPGFQVSLPGDTGPRPRPGPRVAYVAVTDTGFDLFTARADGSGVRRLTETGNVSAPQWSPDHRTIAFTVTGRRGGNYSLFTVGADGHGLRRLAKVFGYGPPDLGWSPDGRQLAYGSGASSASSSWRARNVAVAGCPTTTSSWSPTRPSLRAARSSCSA